MNPAVDNSLLQYIENEIIPRYSFVDKAHSLDHISHVVENSLSLAEKLGLNVNMAYVIAAYHDLGNALSRERHHIISGDILYADENLRRWFSEDEIVTMREAVEDHRASSKHEPRSIYGKVVSDADRELSPTTVISRTIQFGIHNYPELSREGHYYRMVEHLQEKYSAKGYIRLYFDFGQNRTDLEELRRIIADECRLHDIFNDLFDELSGSAH